MIAIAATGISALALRGRSTAAVPADGTSAVKKVVKKKPSQKIVRDAAVELYNQLVVDNVPDAEKQKIIKWTTYNTSFSFDCYEPILQVYDKVYKNMGFGKGIFSWCKRPPQKK